VNRYSIRLTSLHCRDCLAHGGFLTLKLKTMPNSLPMEFNFSTQSQSVRIELINSEPWFVAKDVCDILELSNVSKALLSLDDDEKGITKVQTLGGEQSLLIVNESGLYNLIFRSNKPEAKKFRKWVTNEVLPSIRKTGSFGKSASPALGSSELYKDVFAYCEQQMHEGRLYYAAIHLRLLFGKARNGATNKTLAELQAQNLAAKLVSTATGQPKWFVTKPGIPRLLNIRPNSLVNISIIKSLTEGGVQ
jgi:prophage antirepressor-like protein